MLAGLYASIQVFLSVTKSTMTLGDCGVPQSVHIWPDSLTWRVREKRFPTPRLRAEYVRVFQRLDHSGYVENTESCALCVLDALASGRLPTHPRVDDTGV